MDEWMGEETSDAFAGLRFTPCMLCGHCIVYMLRLESWVSIRLSLPVFERPHGDGA